MIFLTAALLVSVQATTDQQPASPAAPTQVKEKKICKFDDTSGTRMAKRLCLTEKEWAAKAGGKIEGSRSGMTGRPEDH
jgi:Spy/CpxP family protein refolding chaperone